MSQRSTAPLRLAQLSRAIPNAPPMKLIESPPPLSRDAPCVGARAPLDSNACNARTKPEHSADSDTVSAVTTPRLGGLLARGLIVGAAAIIVVIGTVLTWPGAMVGPSADERRIVDLQRLSHAVDAFRARQHVL